MYELQEERREKKEERKRKVYFGCRWLMLICRRDPDNSQTSDICLMNWSMKRKRLVPAEEMSRPEPPGGQQSEQLYRQSESFLFYIWASDSARHLKVLGILRGIRCVGLTALRGRDGKEYTRMDWSMPDTHTIWRRRRLCGRTIWRTQRKKSNVFRGEEWKGKGFLQDWLFSFPLSQTMLATDANLLQD